VAIKTKEAAVAHKGESVRSDRRHVDAVPGKQRMADNPMNSADAGQLAPGGAEPDGAHPDGQKKCVALHSFEGLDLDQITSIAPRQNYSGVHGRELLEYGVAAVKIAKLGGRFSRPVFLELEKRFKAGKKSKHYFLGFKSIGAMCKHLGISRKHFYNVINDNPSGRKVLSPEERAAKDAAKEETRVKREQAKADREAKRRGDEEGRKREAEELKAARENSRKLQLSLDKKDDDIAKAKQAGADEAMSKAATTAAQKEKRPEGFSPEPKTDRDIYYFSIGAGSVRGVNLGSPVSVVKIVFQLLDGQIAGRKEEEVREILRGLSLGIQERVNRVEPHLVKELEDPVHFAITTCDEFDIEYALEAHEIDATAENVAAVRRHPRMSEIAELTKAGWDVIWTIIDELDLSHRATSAIQSKHCARE